MKFKEMSDSRARHIGRGAPGRQDPPRDCHPQSERRLFPKATAASGPRWRLAAMVLMLAPIAAAQQGPVSERAFFAPVEVSVVNVEVFAADARGRPIAGLISSDFEIQEDGGPVTITHFYAAPRVARDRSGAALEPFAEHPEVSQDLHLIIFFDDNNLSTNRRRRALDAVNDWLPLLPDGVQVMIVRWSGTMEVVQQFTNDVKAAGSALQELGQSSSRSLQTERDRIRNDMKRYSNTAAIAYVQHIRAYAQSATEQTLAMMRGLDRLVRSAAGLRGRKAILLVSDGIDTNPGADLIRAWQQVFPDTARTTDIAPSLEAQRINVSESLDTLIENANTRRVIVHAIGATGSSATTSISADREVDITLRGGFDSRSQYDAGRVEPYLARLTGGRVLGNDRKLVQQLGELAAELDGYYSLAYRPNHTGDGQYHRIKVRVADDDVALRHRDGYRDTRHVDRISDRTLTAAALGITDNPLAISAEGREQQPRDDGMYLVPIVIKVPLSQLSLVPRTTDHEGRVSVTVAVRDDRGGLSDIQRREYPIQIPHEQFLSALSQNAEFIMGLVMREGPHRVGVGVRDELGNIDSTATLDVHVGDHDL
jgi:VWFA-related protein